MAVEGFHVMSYQGNFASHLTRHRNVGFLFARASIRKHNNMFRNILSFNHNAKLQLSDKNISMLCTLGGDFKSCYEENQKLQRDLLFFSVPHRTKRNKECTWQNYVKKAIFCFIICQQTNQQFWCNLMPKINK